MIEMVSALPDEKPTKVDTTKDLLTIFSDRVDVKFMKKDGSYEVVRGRWCLVCKSVSVYPFVVMYSH